MKTVVFSMLGGVEVVVHVVWTPFKGDRLKWWVGETSNLQSNAADAREERAKTRETERSITGGCRMGSCRKQVEQS